MSFFLNVCLQEKCDLICEEVGRVTSLLEAVSDVHILEHALTIMKQLTVTLKTNTHQESSSNEQIQPPPFNVLTHFAPAEKNEKQLKFKKTTKSAGRKQKMVPLP